MIAVEPLAEMRRYLAQLAPGTEAIDGTAERIPLATASADAILVAQAFHWFDGPLALDEIARVLKPGGGLGLLWNTTPWELREGTWFQAIDDLLKASRAELSVMRRHGSGRWLDIFEREQRFRPLETATFDNTRLLSAQELLADLGSRSYVAVLGAAERLDLMNAVESLLGRADAPMEAGRVRVPMRTNAYWTGLRSS